MFHETITAWACDHIHDWDVLSEVRRRRTAHRIPSDALTVGELSFHYGGARWGPSGRCLRLIAVPHSG